ncbi:MAG: hypothetical protein FWD19_05765 [Defluviitaleaceae bacterium]|nr:hypothetical protein [Defluviitaleaceae bacterium]
MDDCVIFTNNYAVANYFEQKKLKTEIKWFGTPAIDVLTAVKTAAHLGSVILSSPLSGVRSTFPMFGASRPDVPPTFAPKEQKTQKVRSLSPCISVLVSPAQSTVDFDSVKNIDEALAIYKKNARLRFAAYSDEDIKTYQAIDLENLLTTIAALEKLGEL